MRRRLLALLLVVAALPAAIAAGLLPTLAVPFGFSWPATGVRYGVAESVGLMKFLIHSPPLYGSTKCPLDLSWPNYELMASVCSDENGHSKCCRYINAVIAVSSAMYANTTGILGVPAEISDACIGNISDTLVSKGILPTAASFCGLGIKIQVSYQCIGMTTVLQMLQSPNFSDVTRSCATLLSDDVSCKRCLNSGLSYLRHLVGEQDNVTLNTCRDAAFVAFVSQGNISTVDTASCFFSVQGLSALQVNISVPSPAGLIAPNIAPSPLAMQIPGEHVTGVLSKHHRSYKLALFPAIGALVTGLAVILMIVLILLIRKKSRELEKIEGTNPLDAWSSCLKKGQEGSSTIFDRFTYRQMKKATRNFGTVLGGGEKGTIFKGKLSDGSVVTIRRIESSPKQASGKRLLPWKNRIQIAIDVANALEYLHFYCDPPLCHGDIKPSNVLLDRNYLAKLAVSGLVQCSNGDSTTISSTLVNVRIPATPGYMDPCYVVNQVVTPKSDVYSYGVLLLELVTGKPVAQGDDDGNGDSSSKNLVEWSRELIGTDYRLHELVDPAVADAFDLDELQVMADVIHWCTHRDGFARPSMKQVLRILYERLDPLSGGLARAVASEEGYYYGGGGGGQSGRKGKEGAEMLAGGGGDGGRCLPSSSSTSRSYCSRSVLLECNSPEEAPPQSSPRGLP
uniref:Protein kinase domain-containing protein n=1 Tax=Oryza meridionalis TaxID=40149 RepID=A0A0E0DEB6_9ORYZ